MMIVGAGPAGLASAARLSQRNKSFILIEAEPHVGARWRKHYDRLCLHTTKTHSTLPGLSFPREVGTYPSRSQVVAIKAGDIEVVPVIEAFSASGVTLRNGATREVDVVVLATGYESGLNELLDAPELVDPTGRPSQYAPAARNIHFVGYRNSLTGLLRQIGVEAEVVARSIAAR